ncbi:hypothetical protein, partial [Citrobacter sp. FDAARGOS_156]|uniref:hypothetical protein n=1 Tax=Citrobacter sp. FDAARGOS_156 TaxID=1702170 RepID=UPI0034D73FF3
DECQSSVSYFFSFEVPHLTLCRAAKADVEHHRRSWLNNSFLLTRVSLGIREFFAQLFCCGTVRGFTRSG